MVRSRGSLPMTCVDGVYQKMENGWFCRAGPNRLLIFSHIPQEPTGIQGKHPATSKALPLRRLVYSPQLRPTRFQQPLVPQAVPHAVGVYLLFGFKNKYPKGSHVPALEGMPISSMYFVYLKQDNIHPFSATGKSGCELRTKNYILS
jgi:hypothetical protein